MGSIESLFANPNSDPIFELLEEGYSSKFSSIVCFDRDGTLIKDLGKQPKYVGIEWLPGVLQALKVLIDRGFDISLVSNQSAIGEGVVPLNTVLRVNQQIDLELKLFCGKGLHSFLICPHPKKSNCCCRKPKSVLFEMLSKSANKSRLLAMFGDSDSDVSAAEKFGIPGYLVRPGELESKIFDWLDF